MSQVPRAFLWLALAVGGIAQILGAEPEYKVKAEFLIRMLPFFEFPRPDARSKDPFELVVLGKSPFNSHLDREAQSQTVHQRPIRIRYLKRFTDLGPCDALFLCESEGASVGKVTVWARLNKVLTIGDSRAFLTKGIMVNFVIVQAEKQEKIRFFMNLDEAKAGGITIDSRILRMAEIIGSTPAPEASSPGRRP